MRQYYEGGVAGETGPLAVEEQYKRMEGAVMNLFPDALDLVRAEPVLTTDHMGDYLKMSITYTILDPKLVHHFTYGANHLEGKGLSRYTTVEGVDYDVARDIQVAIHAKSWAFQYEAGVDWDNTVKKFSLKEYERVIITREF